MNHLDALTKLLAEENLQIVVDQSATAASFNTHTRLLTLPVIIGCPEDFKMRLRAHEVGHAKHTPVSLSDTFGARVRRISPGFSDRVAHSLINICEDVRIDRLMLEQYPGLIKEYLSSQIYMAESDFFSLNGRDPNSLSFPDRINLNSKLGMRAGIRFAADEREVLSQVEAANTPAEIIEAALRVLELMMKQEESQKSQPKDEPKDLPKPKDLKKVSPVESDSQPEAKVVVETDETPEESDDEESSGEDHNSAPEVDEESDEESDGYDDESEEDDEESDDEESSGEDHNSASEVDGESDEESDGYDDESEEDDEESASVEASPATQVENPMQISTEDSEKSNLRRMVITNTMRRQIIFGDVSLQHETQLVDLTHSAKAIPTFGSVPWDIIDGLVDKMLSESKSDVDYLVSIFNQRKAAKDAVLKGKYRSGRIDFNRISRHKYSESFFRQYDISPECKNHGVFILLDMSGSMFTNWKDTLQQLMVVVEFCVKTNIPYEVLGFTGARTSGTVRTSSDIQIDGGFPLKLVKIAKTDTSMSDRKECYSALLTAAPTATQHRRMWGMKALAMDSTPIMPAMIEMRSYLRAFISKHRTAKNTLIMISDGAGDGYTSPSSSSSYVYVSPMSGEEMIICGPTSFSKNRGLVFRDEEAKFLEIIKKDFAKFDLTIINFFFDKKPHHAMNPADRATFRRYGMADVGASDGFDKMIFMQSAPEGGEVDITGKETAAALAKKMINRVDSQGKALSRAIMQILA